MFSTLTRPQVIGTLTASTDVDVQLKAARAAGVDLIELRLDTFPFLYFLPMVQAVPAAVLLINYIRDQSRVPILLTLRSHRENGRPLKQTPRLSERVRWEFFKALMPYCAMVDVELRHRSLAQKVAALARRKKVRVMLSAHDFHGVMSAAKFNRLYSVARRLKADVFKAAVMPATPDHVRSFLNWGLSKRTPAVVLIAMGSVGEMSRFVGYSFGSVLTYGHLGETTAPGQPSARTLVRAVRDIYR